MLEKENTLKIGSNTSMKLVSLDNSVIQDNEQFGDSTINKPSTRKSSLKYVLDRKKTEGNKRGRKKKQSVSFILKNEELPVLQGIENSEVNEEARDLGSNQRIEENGKKKDEKNKMNLKKVGRIKDEGEKAGKVRECKNEEEDVNIKKSRSNANLNIKEMLNMPQRINSKSLGNDSFNISFFNDQSINDLVNSYIRNPEERQFSFLECVDLSDRCMENSHINNKRPCNKIRRIDRITDIVANTCDLLGINIDYLKPTESAIEKALDTILLKLKTTTSTSQENITVENKQSPMIETGIEENDMQFKVKYLEDLISHKENILKVEQSKTAEYRRIEASLRNEIDSLYEKLKFEQYLFKHTEAKLKEEECKNRIDNNTFLVDNIERLGNINKEISGDYLSELAVKTEEIKFLKKEKRESTNRINDMQIIIDGLLNKLCDKKERHIDEEINNCP